VRILPDQWWIRDFNNFRIIFKDGKDITLIDWLFIVLSIISHHYRWQKIIQSKGWTRKILEYVSWYTAVVDPEISKRVARYRKGGPPPEIAKNSHILGIKSWVLLTFDGKFRAKMAPSKSATASLELRNKFELLFVVLKTTIFHISFYILAVKIFYAETLWSHEREHTRNAITIYLISCKGLHSFCIRPITWRSKYQIPCIEVFMQVYS
jgi:hypothetical protein